MFSLTNLVSTPSAMDGVGVGGVYFLSPKMALRAGLPVQEAIGTVSRDIKDPVGAIFRRAQQEMQLGVPIETALWRVAKTVETDEFRQT